MKRNLITASLFTVITTILLGVGYPLLVTAIAQVAFRDKANGSLIQRDGKTIGSALLGQPFTGPEYFHPRPSAAGTNGYDATNSGGTNFAPTNQKLVDRVKGDVSALTAENPSAAVPIDAVTTSASGLDPDITLANAEFQLPRVARARGISEQDLHALIEQNAQRRDLGFLGEPRISVLRLNLTLDEKFPVRPSR